MILELVAEGRAQGLSQAKAAEAVGVAPRTLERWRNGPRVRPRRKGQRTHNSLTPVEGAAVGAIIRSSRHADESTRELALALLESPAGISVSHKTVWEHQRAMRCNGPRGRQRRRRAPLGPPDTGWVSAPNQLWDWDVTHLRTQQRGVFLFLYTVMDHVSSKVVAWLISARLVSDEVQRLWDQAIIREGLLNLPPSDWPKSLSDRGAQMRSQSTRSYFKKLGVDQIFSRPRTPNDNPYQEALYATIKTLPAYPGRFRDPRAGEKYFAVFFPWYNEVHPHTRIRMLTPSQVHRGQDQAVLGLRETIRTESLDRRRRYWAGLPEGASDIEDGALQLSQSALEFWPAYAWRGPGHLSSAIPATGCG